MTTEHPIIMSADSVRAILAGRKTQTRRVITRRNSYTSALWRRLVWHDSDVPVGAPGFHPDIGGYLHVPCRPHDDDDQQAVDLWTRWRVFPRVMEDDLLWVKEALKRQPWGNDAPAISYAADGAYAWDITRPAQWVWKTTTLSPIYMPRGLSRLTLRVAAVRAERLQEISPLDVMAEGICWYNGVPVHVCGNACTDALAAIERYRAVWDSLNAKRGFPWEANPWVWVYTFERIESEVTK